MSMPHDLEYDLMTHCLKSKGKWWANRFFRNVEVNKLYNKLRRLEMGLVISIIESKGLETKLVINSNKQQFTKCIEERKGMIAYCNDRIHYLNIKLTEEYSAIKKHQQQIYANQKALDTIKAYEETE